VNNSVCASFGPLPSELTTRAFWYVLDHVHPRECRIDADHFLPGALHAIEHAAIGMMPLFTIYRWDVGFLLTPLLHDTP